MNEDSKEFSPKENKPKPNNYNSTKLPTLKETISTFGRCVSAFPDLSPRTPVTRRRNEHKVKIERIGFPEEATKPQEEK